MIQKLAEKYSNLINHNVPRTSTPNPDADNSDIPAERTTLETDEQPKPPADGFIVTYCREDSR